MLVDNLLKKSQPARAVVRNGFKAQKLKIRVLRLKLQIILMYKPLKNLSRGSSVFLLALENPQSNDFTNEIQMIK